MIKKYHLGVFSIEMQNCSINVSIIKEIQSKIDRIPELQNKTAQKVLISKSEATRELKNKGFFTKIILAEDFMSC